MMENRPEFVYPHTARVGSFFASKRGKHGFLCAFAQVSDYFMRIVDFEHAKCYHMAQEKANTNEIKLFHECRGRHLCWKRLEVFVCVRMVSAEALLHRKCICRSKRRSLNDRIQALACVVRRGKSAGSCMDALRLGYSRNCGVYRLRVSCRRRVEGDDAPGVLAHAGAASPPASLVEDGVVEVPALGHGCARRRMHHLRGQRRRPHPHQCRPALPGGRKLRHRGRHSAAAGHSGMAAAGGSAGRGRCRRGEERCAGRDGPEQRVGQRRRCGPQPEDSARGHRLGKLQGREGRPRCTGRTRPEGRHRPAGSERRKRRYRPGRPCRCDRPARPEGPRRARRERRWRWMPPSPCQAQRQMPRPSAARWPGKPLPAILTATPVLPRRAVRPTVSTDSPLRPRRPTPVQAAALPPTRCSSCMRKGGRRWQRGSM